MPENELYVLSVGTTADDEDGWVQPRPLEAALVDAIVSETDLAESDLDDIDDYVDRDDITTLLDGSDGEETVSFTVEGYGVTVDGSGHVDVAEA
jgi:hypothetical protein